MNLLALENTCALKMYPRSSETKWVRMKLKSKKRTIGNESRQTGKIIQTEPMREERCWIWYKMCFYFEFRNKVKSRSLSKGATAPNRQETRGVSRHRTRRVATRVFLRQCGAAWLKIAQWCHISCLSSASRYKPFPVLTRSLFVT